MPLRLPEWISPKIRIDATPDEFVFSGTGGAVRYTTLIRLGADRRIYQIGDEAVADEPGTSLVRLAGGVGYRARISRDTEQREKT